MTDNNPDEPLDRRSDGLSQAEAARGAELLLGLGHELYKRGQFEAARRVLDRAIELGPRLIPSYLVQCLTCRELKAPVAAVHFAAQAAKLDPQRTDAMMLLAQALLEAKMFDQALPILEHLLTIEDTRDWATMVLREVRANQPEGHKPQSESETQASSDEDDGEDEILVDDD